MSVCLCLYVQGTGLASDHKERNNKKKFPIMFRPLCFHCFCSQKKQEKENQNNINKKYEPIITIFLFLHFSYTS